MKKTNIKLLFIVFLFITSVSIIGWRGALFQRNDTSELTQINEVVTSSSENSPLLINEDSLYYSDSSRHYLSHSDPDPSKIGTKLLKSDYISLKMPKLSIESVQYVPRGVISITGDNDPLWQNFTGRGTLSEPYLITDFEITANHTHLISIRDTTVYFTISQNLLDGISGSYYGIFLDNVTNGFIYQNSIGFASYGIRMIDSYEMNISENDVHNSTWNGMYLQYSVDNFLGGNNVYTSEHGISLSSSSRNTIDSNWVGTNRKQGIAIYNSSFLNIQNNVAWNNAWKGFIETDSINNTFSFNTASFNGNDGIYSYNCNSSKFYDNTLFNNAWNGLVSQGNSNNLEIGDNEVFDNTHVGLRLEYLSFSTVESNNVYQNMEHGIWLYSSSSNQIIGNDIYRNSIDGVSFEDGSDSNQIISNIITQNGANGITIINSDNNIFENNDINSNGGSTSGAPVTDPLGEIRFSIQGSTNGHGIYLDPSQGNVIYDNRINNNFRSGTYLLEADGNEILNNIISDNGESGVFLENSSFNTISWNEIGRNGFGDFGATVYDGEIQFSIQGSTNGHGIYLDPSHQNFIEGNVIYNNFANGLHLFQSDDSTITGNHVLRNSNGIFLEDSGSNNISWNIISRNGYPDKDNTPISGDIKFSITGSTNGHGIYLDPSDFNLVEHNNIYDNQGHGLYVVDSDSTKILKNLISVNGLYGIFIDLTSSESIVSQNDFIYNHLGGESQALDDGVGNFFDGNYWSDRREGEEVYEIDGAAKNQDSNPAEEPIINPEYEFSPPKVIRPNGGETLSGTVKIEWIGAESDISLPLEMTHMVLYSPDAGDTWHHVYFSFKDDSTSNSSVDGEVGITIEWDTSNLVDGSEYLIQVLAIDGSGFVMSDSSDNVFIIKNGAEPTTTTTETEETSPSLTPSWTLIVTFVGISVPIVIRKRKRN
ncbi:MAG: right-handed parallel beta-helix repeat-containing protein [Candidatus Hodarchaeales archaeon]|jgi:parallel beta-helix repeat protein